MCIYSVNLLCLRGLPMIGRWTLNSNPIVSRTFYTREIIVPIQGELQFRKIRGTGSPSGRIIVSKDTRDGKPSSLAWLPGADRRVRNGCSFQ